MSTITYNNLLLKTSSEITLITQKDEDIQQLGLTERTILQPLLTELKLRYVVLMKKLDLIHDQLLQPQKRILVKKMLDACLGRFLEIKHELVELDLSDYSYDNDLILRKLKVTPQEAEPSVPKYFITEREQEVHERRQFIEDILTKLGYEPSKPKAIVLTEQQAVLIIQSHERARQGRLRGQFMKEIKLLKEKGRDAKNEMSDSSALSIQKMWRGFLARRETKKRKLEEMYLIGMEMKNYQVSEQQKKVEEVKEHRRHLQLIKKRNYEEALYTIEQNLREKHEARLAEQIGDELRKWIWEFYDRTGKLPEMPSEDAGGSRSMFSGQGAESEFSKSSPVSSQDSKRSKDSKKKSEIEEIKPRDEEVELEMYECKSSSYLSDLVDANEEFNDIWKYNEDSATNEDYVKELIEKEKMIKIEEEIRIGVDCNIRTELETLQAACDKDRATKGKKAKKPQKKTRKSGKKSKKKKEKDLTPDRTTESLFEELISNGIIRPYPKVGIDEFIGEKCFLAADMRTEGKEQSPYLGDVRQLVKEYCILPLGSQEARLRSPLVRSVLITGPSRSGKKMLVRAICSEVGAVLFDLTPANIVGKYPGKTGLIMLLHLVIKVSRLLQPSVIWMDDAEKPFVKKIPKTDKTDPKRLKKDLIKLIKAITPEDKVIFIGSSKYPWEAEQKLLFQCYAKVIQIPRPDYSSISLFWNTKLYQAGALSHNLDICSLARISDSYTIGTLIAALDEVLTTKRSLQLKIKALSPYEIALKLSAKDPIYAEHDFGAETWWFKTPMEKKKQKILQKLEELRLEREENAANASNK